MFKKIFLTVVLCSFVFVGYSSSSGVKKQDKLIIAIQPTSTSKQLESQAKELESFLEEQLKMEVEILFPTSYAGVIEALRFGHADVAFMGSWPATMAKKHAGAEVILSEIREVIIDEVMTEAPYYFSYWVVLKDSNYNKLDELNGKKAAFPSQLSSSGYVAPLSRLVDLGFLALKKESVDPKDFFGEVLFAGGYAQSWEALKQGQVDVSIIAGDVPESLYREVLASTRIIEKQGPIPSHVVVANKNMDQVLKDEVAGALLALNAPEHRDLMRKFVSGIFVRFEKASEDHLDSLERMLTVTGFQFEEKK